MLSFLKMLLGEGASIGGRVDANEVDLYAHAAMFEPDELAMAAANRAHRAVFLQLLAEKGVWIIMRLDQGLYEGDLHVLEYEEGDRLVLPVFSSLPEASAFLHTIEMMELLPFQYLHVPTSFLTHNDLTSHKVIFNPFAGATTEIAESDIAALRNWYEGY